MPAYRTVSPEILSPVRHPVFDRANWARRSAAQTSGEEPAASEKAHVVFRFIDVNEISLFCVEHRACTKVRPQVLRKPRRELSIVDVSGLSRSCLAFCRAVSCA
jgi:hypothetical protein